MQLGGRIRDLVVGSEAAKNATGKLREETLCGVAAETNLILGHGLNTDRHAFGRELQKIHAEENPDGSRILVR